MCISEVRLPKHGQSPFHPIHLSPSRYTEIERASHIIRTYLLRKDKLPTRSVASAHSTKPRVIIKARFGISNIGSIRVSTTSVPKEEMIFANPVNRRTIIQARMYILSMEITLTRRHYPFALLPLTSHKSMVSAIKASNPNIKGRLFTYAKACGSCALGMRSYSRPSTL